MPGRWGTGAGRSNLGGCEKCSLPRLPHKIFKRAVWVDPGTSIPRHFPVLLFIQKGGIERPQRTWPGFDRMNQASFFRIIKRTKPVSSADDIEPPVLFPAVLLNEGLRCQSEEPSYSLDFVALNPDPALTIAAGAALFAFKSFHWPQTHTDKHRLSSLSPCGTDMKTAVLKDVTRKPFYLRLPISEID
jgi:hypothetical protein